MSVAERDDSPTQAAAHWVSRLTSGRASSSDREAFDAWIRADPEHRRAFERARLVFTELDRVPAERLQRRSTQWQRAAVVTAVAAGIASFAILVPSWQGEVYSTATGEVRQFSLSDGTLAWLDSDSALAVQYSEDRRSIVLTRGRAHFAVATDGRPFGVETKGARITDIGTAFSVDRTGSGFGVAVTEGEVAVQRDGHVTHLVAGRSAVFLDDESVQTHDNDTGADLAWREGRIVLKETPLREALRKIDRYRSGRIVWLAGSGDDAPVSGVLRVDALEEGIASLLASRSLGVIRLPGLLLVISNSSPSG